jgi:hypothetical protein
MREKHRESTYLRRRAAEFSRAAAGSMSGDLRRQYHYLADRFAGIAAGIEGREAVTPRPEYEYDQ